MREVELIEAIYYYNIAKQKIRLFESKYKMGLEDFEKKLTKEDFERWDDLLEWKAYSRLLKEKEEIIKKHGYIKVS